MKIKEKIDKNGYSLKCGKNVVKLKKLDKHLYEFEKFLLVNHKNTKLIDTLGEKFYSFVKRNKIEIMTENTARDRNQNRFMKRCGLKIKYSKKLFTRTLKKLDFDYIDSFKYQSLDEAGAYKFFRLSIVSIKDFIKKYDRFRIYLNKMKRLVRNTYEINQWKIVSTRNKNIGIIMPHIFPEKPGLGTLLEIGLKPECRGKGYGRIIHAHGLELLKQMGAKKYLGSTETTNYAMLRVFEINGCKKWFIRHFFWAG
jgi:ribosomal protein S18 acetylase RimI-like enzyme